MKGYPINMFFIKRILSKLFLGGYWIVAYRKKGEPFFNVIQNQKGFWNADPFPIEKNNCLYLLTELYDCKKDIGKIAYSKVDCTKFHSTKIVLETYTHMSYPSIFKYKNKTLLMPENSQDGNLNIYDVTESFLEPIFLKTILFSNDFVDCTLELFDNVLLLFGYSTAKNCLFYYKLDEDFSIASNICYMKTSKKSRPAGAFLDGHIRPAQNCANKYGESIIFYDFNFDENFTGTETIVRTLESKDILLRDSKIKPKKIHTFNTTENYEVIDLYVEKIDLFRWLKMLKRRMHKYEKKRNHQ